MGFIEAACSIWRAGRNKTKLSCLLFYQ